MLLSQAETLIRGRGYSGFSYADLSDAVGIRKASIHHHFPTKADLATALVAAYDARYDRALREIMARDVDALATIEAYGELYLLGVENNLGCLCAILAIELHILPETLRADIRRFFTKHLDWLSGVLAAGRDAGTIRRTIEPDASARMVIATLEGALMMERVLHGATGFRSAMTALIDGMKPV